MRKLSCRGAGIQIKWQCSKCGRSIGTAIRHDQVVSIEALDPWDEVLVERQRALGNSQRSEAAHLKEMEWADKRERYREYLRSSMWRDKRSRVMARADGLCEGCRVEEATEVHHLSYTHIYAEFLFELVALCRDCHERWHVLNSPDALAVGQ